MNILIFVVLGMIFAYFVGYFFSNSFNKFIFKLTHLSILKTKQLFFRYINLLLISVPVIVAILLYLFLVLRLNTDEIIQFYVAYFTFLVFIFSVFYQNIQNYKNRPVIEIEFNPYPPDCHETMLANGLPAIFLRFRVLNIGKSTLKNTEVIIEKVITNGNIRSKFLPLNLTWSLTESQSDRSIVNIHQGGFRTIDLVSIINRERAKEIFIDLPQDQVSRDRHIAEIENGMKVVSIVAPNTLSDILGIGEHVAYVSILADNAAPFFAKFKINYDGTFPSEFENEHLKISLENKDDSRGNIFD